MFIPVGINPYMGGSYTLKAFVVAVLGGLASPYGAFFAGLAFGLIENGSYTVFAALPGVEPFALTRFISFVMLLVILLIKPTGLLGAK
jgi:branched-chain amino acid transport system permease protein